MAIISAELWQRVQDVNQRMKDKIYGRRQGGFNRTAASQGYLFSPVTYCGSCGGKFSIIIGGKRARYGCRNHRFRDACTNKVTILRTRLEHQLISAISTNLLDPRLEQDRIRDFFEQLKSRIESEEKLLSEAAANVQDWRLNVPNWRSKVVIWLMRSRNAAVPRSYQRSLPG